MLVGWQYAFRSIALNDVYVFAQQSKRFTEITFVLVLRIHRYFTANSHTDDDLWAAGTIAESDHFVEMIYDLIRGTQQKVPSRNYGHRNQSCYGQASADTNLEIFCYGEFYFVWVVDHREAFITSGSAISHGLSQKHSAWLL
jgi:hypothetical protein